MIGDEQTGPSMPKESKVHRYFSSDLLLRAAAADTTEVVREAQKLQGLSPLATLAVGRAITGALLMSSQLREGQAVGLYFKGDGPLGTLFAEATYESHTRAYCANPKVALKLKDGHLDLPTAIGKGDLQVTRTQPFQKQPHIGLVPLWKGEIAQDIAYYLFQSDQVPSIVSLTVQMNEAGQVLAAGGVILEVMPGATDKVLSELEKNAGKVKALSELIARKSSLKEWVVPFSHDPELTEVVHDFPILYKCRCSQERVDRSLTILGKATLSEMILQGDPAHITCQFCGRNFTVPVSEIRTILETLK